VFVVHNNRAELRPVQTGSDAGTMLEIVSGINPGDLIVTNGQNNLRSGTKVTIINKQRK
jgi:multidrug efflux pump subunit AcrA (membrane-fusion protein)